MMIRLLKFLTAVVPYIAAEAIQYFIYSVILLTGNYVNISDGLLYTLSAVVIAVCGIIFFFWYRYEISGEVRGSIKNLLSVKYISLFLFLGIGCQFFFTGVMSLIQNLFTEAFSNYSKVLQNLTSGNEVIVLLLLVLIAPVTEELIFRGVTLHMANRQITFLGANLFQAILFGIYHGNVIQGIYAALLGFLLGAVYYKFKTIFAPILLHMIINTSSLIVSLVPDQTLSYFIIMIVGGISVIVTLLMINPAKTAQQTA